MLTLSAGTTLVFDAAARDADERVKSVDGRSADTRDQIRAQATTGSVLLGAGALFAVATGVLAFTARWSDQRRIVIGPRGLGLGLAGEF